MTMMEMSDNNDLLTRSDDNGHDLGGPDCANPLHSVKGKYMNSKGE